MRHIQLDELVNKVRHVGRRVWIWTAQDALNKAWLAWHVGKRTQADAHRLVHRVKGVLAGGCVPVFKGAGTERQNPNSLYRAAESDDTALGGGAVTAGVGIGV